MYTMYIVYTVDIIIYLKQVIYKADLTSPWTLVVKQDPVAGIHAVGLTVVDDDPVGI